MIGPLITVIIPIYGVEKYLEKCVDSVLSQTYHNIEILLVDDGSPNRCGEIIDEYEKKDSRIVALHKENGGLSDARNYATPLAKGDFTIWQLVRFRLSTCRTAEKEILSIRLLLF